MTAIRKMTPTFVDPCARITSKSSGPSLLGCPLTQTADPLPSLRIATVPPLVLVHTTAPSLDPLAGHLVRPAVASLEV